VELQASGHAMFEFSAARESSARQPLHEARCVSFWKHVWKGQRPQPGPRRDRAVVGQESARKRLRVLLKKQLRPANELVVAS